MAIVTKAIEEIENNPELKEKIISILKEMGIEVLKKEINNPVGDIFMATI